jgi:hypothetical protein
MVNQPIRPSQYERLLKGAIVEVHFTLMSWVFAGKNLKAMNIPVRTRYDLQIRS